MAHHVDARYDEVDGMFVPPLRTLGFNPQLQLNDSLLVQSYIESYDISYPEALRRIESEVAELRSRLEAEGLCELNDIGVLRLNEEGKIEFEPCEAGLLTPELYGFGSFEMRRLDALKPVAVQQTLQSEVSPDDGAITIKMSWLRNMVAAAAAVIAFLMIGTPVSNSTKSDVQQSAFINVSSSAHHRPVAVQADKVSAPVAVEQELTEVPQVTVQTDLISTPTAAPAASPSSSVSQPTTFCIVMASQVSERNANLFIEQLLSPLRGE